MLNLMEKDHSIPKIIHYCWFGDKVIPLKFQKFIDRWKNLLPAYEFIFWQNESLPKDYEYVQAAFKNKKWVNLSNFIRLYSLKMYGGIYLDVDMEIIKPFDKLLNNLSFLGIESIKNDEIMLNNAIFGAIKDHAFVNECLNHLLNNYKGMEIENITGPVLTTLMYKKYKNQLSKTITIYPQEYFYPSNWETPTKINITSNTYTIHHWEASWHNEFQNLLHKKFKKSLKIYFYHLITGQASLKSSIRYIKLFVNQFLRTLVNK